MISTDINFDMIVQDVQKYKNYTQSPVCPHMSMSLCSSVIKHILTVSVGTKRCVVFHAVFLPEIIKSNLSSKWAMNCSGLRIMLAFVRLLLIFSSSIRSAELSPFGFSLRILSSRSGNLCSSWFWWYRWESSVLITCPRWAAWAVHISDTPVNTWHPGANITSNKKLVRSNRQTVWDP